MGWDEKESEWGQRVFGEQFHRNEAAVIAWRDIQGQERARGDHTLDTSGRTKYIRTPSEVP